MGLPIVPSCQIEAGGNQRGCKSKKRDQAVGEALNRRGWGPGVGWGECSLRPRGPGLDGTLIRGGWPPGLLLCPAANMFSPCRCWRLWVYPWSHLSRSVVGSGSRGTMVLTESLKGEAFFLPFFPESRLITEQNRLSPPSPAAQPPFWSCCRSSGCASADVSAFDL